MNSDLRISTPDVEGHFEASKWLAYPVLIDIDEMQDLFEKLGPFFIYMTNRIVEFGKERIIKEDFLRSYSDYVNALKHGILPEINQYRPYFSSIFTAYSGAVYGMKVENQLLVKVSRPVIQLQVNCIDYSEIDGKFRSMVFGIDSILWGIQFAYPQIYQDNKTKQIMQVKEGLEFPNTTLFKVFQKWLRSNTIPTPFYVKDKKINVPFRIGKQCLPWINKHPQLQKREIKVIV